MFEVLGGDPSEAFHVPAHAEIAGVMTVLARAGRAVDLMTLAERLEWLVKLEAVGGVSELADISGASPTSANIAHYAGIVRDLHVRRRLQDLSRQAYERAQDTSTDLTAVLEGVEQQIFALAHRRAGRAATQVREHIKEAYSRIEAASLGTHELEGLSFGLPDLDRLTGGLKPGEVTIVAARPSVGKTAFACNVAVNTHVDHGGGVLIFSLEMTALQLTSRLLCLTGGVDVERIKSGFLGRETISKAQWAASSLDQAPIWIDESVSLTPMDLRARSRRHAAQHKGLGLIIIDYLQLMHTSGRSENRQNEVSEISRAVKCVARELNVPVLCLSQLSREAEKNAGYGPQLSHLRDSGAIEQDADVVLMLSRPPKSNHDGPAGTINIRVAKNRNGLTGDVCATFIRSTQQFKPGEAEGRGPTPPPPDDDYEDTI
jgi:replicative DNA helicase